MKIEINYIWRERTVRRLWRKDAIWEREAVFSMMRSEYFQMKVWNMIMNL